MDIRQLRALVAVGEHHSFSAAARALHTVQSNVSTHISRLEHELGATLIDRATNELTDEGVIVAERARRIDGEFAALESDLAALRDVVSGNVRIGVIGTTARWLVPPLLEAMAKNYPDVHLVILDATTSSLVLQLSGGRLDMAVLNGPIHEPDLLVRTLFDEDRLLVAPAGHPLFDRESVTLQELAEHELLMPAGGTSFRNELDDQATALGVSYRARAEVDGMRLLASLAFSGFGAAILPASAAPTWIGGEWRRIPIVNMTGRSVELARRRRGLPSAAERAVAATVHQVVVDQAPHQSGVHPA